MSDTSFSTHTDLSRDGWVDRYVPGWLRPYFKLARFDRPIGIWLLLLPGWWSIAIASPNAATGFGLALLFLLGAIVMRGAGCTFNDILDRHVDAGVERTRLRPLPSGQVGVVGASVFLLLELAVGLAILLQLNRPTFILGVASLAPVGAYPLMKRYTWWPQAFLGLTFNWGAIMGWTAATGGIAASAIVLYAAGFCWTLVYDTIYAHQDARDDALIGVKSTALLLGRHSRLWLIGFAAAMVALLDFAGALGGLGPVFGLMLIPVALHLAWLLLFWTIDDPADCLTRFQASRWTGVLVLLALIVGRLIR